MSIRERRLYRASLFHPEGYATFEDYCRERWGLKQTTAYQMIEAANVVGNLKSSTIVELSNEEDEEENEIPDLSHDNICCKYCYERPERRNAPSRAGSIVPYLESVLPGTLPVRAWVRRLRDRGVD